VDGTTAPVDLAAHLALLPSSLRGVSLGPAKLDGRLEGTDLTLAPSYLMLPGAVVHLSGAASPTHLAAQARGEALDLRELAGAASRILRRPLPPVSGHGQATLHVGGSPRAPSLEADLDLPELALGTVAASQLSLYASRDSGGTFTVSGAGRAGPV